MESLREWIMQIAGVVVLGAVCDIIIIDGGMKKYVKPVLGFVLIFTVMRPVVGGLSGDFAFDESMPVSAELSVNLEGVEKDAIVELYQGKMAQTISDKIKERFGITTETTVLASTEEDSFGTLENVKIRVIPRYDKAVNAEKIKGFVCESFGVEASAIDVMAEQEEVR